MAFYQYFSDKDESFRHLAGHVARQLWASLEAMGTLGPDGDGWSALRAWIGRHGDIHARDEPVHRVFDAAAGSDEYLAGDSARVNQRQVTLFQSKMSTSRLPPRQLEPVVSLLCTAIAVVHIIEHGLLTGAPAT